MTEEEIKSKLDMDSARFLTLISMFSASAYQSMGKLANPMTGKIERNLEAAQGFIGILIMLKKKTAGNLSSEETRILASTISDLELNFVQEKNKPEPEKEGKSTEEEGGAGKSKEEEGGAGKSKEEQGEAGKSKEEQGEAGKSKEEEGGAGKSKEEQGEGKREE